MDIYKSPFVITVWNVKKTKQTILHLNHFHKCTVSWGFDQHKDLLNIEQLSLVCYTASFTALLFYAGFIYLFWMFWPI